MWCEWIKTIYLQRYYGQPPEVNEDVADRIQDGLTGQRKTQGNWIVEISRRMPSIQVAGDICLRRPRPAQGCRPDDDDTCYCVLRVQVFAALYYPNRVKRPFLFSNVYIGSRAQPAWVPERAALRSGIAEQLPGALRIGNMVLVNQGFHTRNNLTENYPRFGHGPVEMFASPCPMPKMLGDWFEEARLLLCPERPHVWTRPLFPGATP